MREGALCIGLAGAGWARAGRMLSCCRMLSWAEVVLGLFVGGEGVQTSEAWVT